MELLEGMEPADRGYGQMIRKEMKASEKHQLKEVAEGKLTLEEFMEQLSDRDLAELLGDSPIPEWRTPMEWEI